MEMLSITIDCDWKILDTKSVKWQKQGESVTKWSLNETSISGAHNVYIFSKPNNDSKLAFNLC